jgi:hypothetical protein
MSGLQRLWSYADFEQVWMYLMSFMDRVSIGNARLYEMEFELGMENNDYLLAVSVLFITYCVSTLNPYHANTC